MLEEFDNTELKFSYKVKSDLLLVSRWGVIAAVIGFMLGLILFLLFITFGAFLPAVVCLLFTIPIGVYSILFSRSIKQAIDSSDNYEMEYAFKQLNIFFKIAGIITIIYIIFAVWGCMSIYRDALKYTTY